MADGDEGGIGGISPGAASYVARRRHQRALVEQTKKRRRSYLVLSDQPTTPPSSSETEVHTLQADFVTTAVSQPAGSQEVTTVFDADGGMRFYTSGGTSLTLDQATGNPLATVASTTLTNLYSFTVPANTCAAGDKLRLELFLVVTQNSGSAQNVRLKLLGTAGTWHESAGSFANDADPYGVRLTIDLMYLATGAQIMSFSMQTSSASASATGWGNWAGVQFNGGGFKTTAETETASMAFTVQMRFDTSAASSSINLYSATLTKIGAV